MAGAKQNYGRGAIASPVSLLHEQMGYVDSFRTVHPDPSTHAGDSWSPLDDHQHYRIDYIYHHGTAVVPTASTYINRVVPGEARPFPSDHGGFVTAYEWLD